MSNGANVFDATIKASDEATKPISRVMGGVRALGAAVSAMTGLVRGLGAVSAAAFGEMEHGAQKAGHAAHGAAKEIGHAGNAAQKAGHQMERAAHGRSWLALAGHVRLLRGSFGELNAGVGEIGHTITEFLPALGALGAAAGLAGLFEVAERAAETFGHLEDTAAKIGTTIAQFQQLEFVAELTGVQVDAVAGAVFKLNKAMGDAAAGKNQDVAALFAHLKLQLKDANGHIRAATDVLPELAAAFSRTVDPAMQARAAMALFGKSGMEMLPMLMKGKEEFEDWAAVADKVNFNPGAFHAQALRDYDDALKVVTASAKAFTFELGAKLAPVLAPVVQLAGEWVTANRDWITTAMAERVGELALWVQKLDLGGIVKDARDWFGVFRGLAPHIDAVATAIGAAGLAVGAFGAMLASNPVGLAVSVFVVGAYEIHKHWFKLKDFFVGLWRDIQGIFDGGWQRIKPIVDALSDAGSAIAHSWVGRQFGGNPDDVQNSILGGPPDTDMLLRNELIGPPGAPPPSLSGATPPPAQNGHVGVSIKLEGAPPGTTVRTTNSGVARRPDVDVGYGQAGMAGAY